MPLPPALRHLARALRRSWGAALIVVLTLGLGIGGATALFSVANGVLLRPLPVRAQDEVVVAWRADQARQIDRQTMREDLLLDYGRESRVFRETGVMTAETLNAPMKIDDDIVYAQLSLVSGNFFSLLGAQPLVGRTFTPEDDVLGAEPVAILGEGLWRRVWGADPGIVGRTVRFMGRERTVVGVMPRNFALPRGTELWSPAVGWAPSPTQRVQFPIFALVGRLAPGVAPATAADDFTAYLQRRAAELPEQLPSPAADLHPLVETVVGDVRPVIVALGAASALLLAIACFNVANLLLMRGVARQREYAVQAALGAGRGRLVRQRLAESLALGLGGGALGVLAAWAAVRALVRVAPADLPRLEEITVDGRVLAAAVLASLVAAAVAGVSPALWAARANPSDALRGSGRGVTGGRALRHVRRLFVVGQFALTIVVLAGAGLLANSLLRLTTVPLGFRTEGVTELPIVASGAKYNTPQNMTAVIEQLLPRAQQVPGIESATAVAIRPLGGPAEGEAAYLLDGQAPAEAGANPLATVQPVDESFFATLDIPLRAGRTFTERDRGDSPPVVVISETLARRLWPNEPAVGRRLALQVPDEPLVWREVVGVVGETRYRDPTLARPAIYYSWRQTASTPLTLLVRSRLDPAQLRAALLPALREVEPELWLPTVRPMTELAAEPLVRPRFYALLLGVFAFGAVFLAGIGVYGLMATAVAERRAELGVRLTLGARPGGVFRLVLGEGLRLAAAGIAIGLVAAVLLTRGLATLLYDLQPTDVPTFLAVTGVLLAAGALACAVPALRAARTAPGVVLREG